MYEKEIKSKNLDEEVLQMFEEKINLIKDHAEEVKNVLNFQKILKNPLIQKPLKNRSKIWQLL